MNIVFDLGGVLFGWSPHRLVARLLPAHAPDEAAAQALSAALFENFGGQWAEFDRGIVEAAALANGIAQRTGLTAAQARSVIDAVPDELQAIPEMLGLLERLRAAGHALYFLSNMPAPYVGVLLPRHDFLREFAAGVFSSQVGLIKPEAAIYAHALEAFGIDAADTLFIDDVAANAQAARDAGWQALHFIDPAQCGADLVRQRVLLPEPTAQPTVHRPQSMTQPAELTFFHAPNSRSGGVLILLEELGAEYAVHLLDLKSAEQRRPEYLAVNPMGKVPALLHRGALVTEQVAVYLYLADLFPQAGITPAIGDPLRGPFLRWLAFYGSSFEPALIDRSQGHPPPPPSTAPWGDYDTMLKTLSDQLARGPYLLGERFTAADVLWGSALTWTTMFKLVPELPVIKAYIDRVNARPAFVRAKEKDAALVASQG